MCLCVCDISSHFYLKLYYSYYFYFYIYFHFQSKLSFFSALPPLFNLSSFLTTPTLSPPLLLFPHHSYSFLTTPTLSPPLLLFPHHSLLLFPHHSLLLFLHHSYSFFTTPTLSSPLTPTLSSPPLAGKDAGSDSSINTIDTKLNRRESHMTVKRRNSTAPNVLFNFTCDSETSLVFERDPDVRYRSTAFSALLSTL